MAAHPVTNFAEPVHEFHHDISDPWAWTMAADAAQTLPPSKLSRWLVVKEGEVWLTDLGAADQADDVWLRSGQRHALPAGTRWLLQAWPTARVEVLEAPPQAPRFSASAPWRSGVERLLQGAWQRVSTRVWRSAQTA